MTITLRNGWAALRSGPEVGFWFLLVAIAAGILVALLPIVQAFALLAPFVILLIYVEPLIGAGLMLLAAPLGALEAIALGTGLLDSGQMLFLLTTAIWLARGAAKRRIRLPVAPLSLPLLLFIAAAVLTLLDASSLMTGFREVIKWLEVSVIMIMVLDLSRTLPNRPVGRLLGIRDKYQATKAILFLILLGGVSQALIGIWQFGFREAGPEHFQVAGGRFYRAYGTFEQPNPFGGFMSWMALLGLGAVLGQVAHRLQTRSFGGRSLLWPIFLATVSAFFLAALIFSWSRGAWLGFAAGVAAMLFFFPRRRLRGIALVGFGVVILLTSWNLDLVPPAVAERVAGFTEDLRFGDVRGADINDANYAVLERLAHWQAALDMARYNLLDGVGFGNYEVAYPDYALINWPDALGHAHNYYLNLIAETGVVGLLSYLLLWILVIWHSLKAAGQHDWPGRGVALGLLGVWITLSVHHLLDKLYVNNLYLYVGALLGALQLLYESGCRRS